VHGDWREPQKQSEGKCWRDPVNKAAVPNTWTGKGGSG
jgi:hypothetical protein